MTNAATLAQTLMDGGLELVSGGTDNHLMLVDLKNMDLSGKELEVRLDSLHITANKNAVPADPRGADGGRFACCHAGRRRRDGRVQNRRGGNAADGAAVRMQTGDPEGKEPFLRMRTHL